MYLRNMMKLQILVFSACVAFSGVSFSQTPNPDNNNNQNQEGQGEQRGRKGFWEANLAGGNYVVALSRITSVSRHRYVLDAMVIVDEVTVDTDGQSLARFYFLTPVTNAGPDSNTAKLAERALELANKTASEKGSTAQDMVQKKYPLTTHSKTVEYRLMSEGQLNALYQSVKTAWQTGDGRVYKGQ
jgi:hypothetical protein